MQTTTNYGFTIAEGSDSVNLLTQLYPNFTSLDGILLPIQNNGTTPATHTKAGTVHQLVRTTTGCSVLRFVATGNYSAGDTFTVDGSSVTATSCNGQSLPAGAFVINQSVMAILNGAVLTVLAGGSSISDASDVVYNNAVSGLTATNVQDAIDEVYGDIPTSFAGSDVTYNNAVSGLTATDVQTAIDEIALGGSGTEHGLYELWSNPDIVSAFIPQTVTINDVDPTKFDALIFVTEAKPSEQYGAVYNEIEATYFNNFGSDRYLIAFYIQSGSYHGGSRKITNITTTSTSISIVFGDGYDDSVVSNTCGIPIRIMGLIHNA